MLIWMDHRFKGALSKIQKALLLVTPVAVKWTAASNLGYMLVLALVYSTYKKTHSEDIFHSLLRSKTKLEINFQQKTVHKHPAKIHTDGSNV